MPDDWLMGLMIPIFKKRVKLEWEINHGICLLSSPYELLADMPINDLR